MNTTKVKCAITTNQSRNFTNVYKNHLITIHLLSRRCEYYYYVQRKMYKSTYRKNSLVYLWILQYVSVNSIRKKITKTFANLINCYLYWKTNLFCWFPIDLSFCFFKTVEVRPFNKKKPLKFQTFGS